MDALTEQIQNELERIVSIVSELTGLPSRWSGRVEIVPDANFKGKKRFGCDIQINAAWATQEARWATSIHEALHCVSAGYVASDYRDWPGWEEGVVEQLQRQLRPTILARLSVHVAEDIFESIQAYHRYNEYIAYLEDIRRSLTLEERTFYSDLLRTPIRRRPEHILGLGRQLPGERYKEFVRIFSASNAGLKGFLDPTP